MAFDKISKKKKNKCKNNENKNENNVNRDSHYKKDPICI